MFDLIIIGGGPAGLTAAIYAGRALLKTLLLEKLVPGGLVATTEKIENYPGFGSVAGMELAKKMEDQARKFGVEIVTEEVNTLAVMEENKIVRTQGNEYQAKAAIIATGTKPKNLNVPGEDKFRGRGVSYCATCDGAFFKDKDVAVIGCGSSGLKEGLFLLRYVKHISFVEFLPHMTAEKILQERIKKESNVAFYLEHMLTSINGEGNISSITIKDRKTGQEKNIEVQGVFIYVGLDPITDFLKGVVELDQYNYIITNEKLETSVPGIFAAGDVRTTNLRQIATAVGDGALTAFMAEEYITKPPLAEKQHID